MISPTGAILASLKARTGLTWGQLADTIGASSGDYVRKVASGAKPGSNLASVVGELMARGEVAKAPARRRAASGAIAKVRAPGATGLPSYRPAETTVRTPGRHLFRAADGKLGWQQQTGSSTPDVMGAVASAGRGQHRVRFRVELKRPHGRSIWADVGLKDGYTPAQVRAGVRKFGSVVDWLAAQMGHRGAASTGSADDIDDVEVIAE